MPLAPAPGRERQLHPFISSLLTLLPPPLSPSFISSLLSLPSSSPSIFSLLPPSSLLFLPPLQLPCHAVALCQRPFSVCGIEAYLVLTILPLKDAKAEREGKTEDGAGMNGKVCHLSSVMTWIFSLWPTREWRGQERRICGWCVRVHACVAPQEQGSKSTLLLIEWLP